MGLTIAVAGLNFGELWVPLYQLHPDVDRVVLCDASAETLQRVGTATGIADRVQSLDDVFTDPRIDAVHLLTPLHLHAEQTLAALRAGKHCAVAVTPALELDPLGWSGLTTMDWPTAILHQFCAHRASAAARSSDG